jgi:Ca2+-binding RTX toxin-like protein
LAAISTLPAGTTYVEAVYPATGNYTGSTSNIVAQVVKAIATSTALSSSSNPSNVGQPVTFTATVSSGSGIPGGPVTFYSCTSSGCGTKSSLGTGTLNGAGIATASISTLPVGTTYIEAVYGASGNYLGSTSTPLGQVVKPASISTSTGLSSTPNPSTLGQSVTFTATVSAGSGTPGSSVSFYGCSTSSGCGTKTILSTRTLDGSGKATYSPTNLPVGTTYIEAIYGGSGNYTGSTSSELAQVVNPSVPRVCASGGYGNYLFGNPSFQFLNGTNGNDFIYAFGATYWIDGFGGNDCVDVGDGNNLIFDGNGNDGVSAGNGSDTVILGNGNDKVSLGNGSDGVETGDGNDTVTVGNGSQNGVVVGNGNDDITIGTGSANQVQLGSGIDTVTVKGSHDEIDGGNGDETVFLGSGTYNTYDGQAHNTNACHLPKPPSSWHGTVAAYYHDTITNCTVVTP